MAFARFPCATPLASPAPDARRPSPRPPACGWGCGRAEGTRALESQRAATSRACRRAACTPVARLRRAITSGCPKSAGLGCHHAHPHNDAGGQFRAPAARGPSPRPPACGWDARRREAAACAWFARCRPAEGVPVSERPVSRDVGGRPPTGTPTATQRWACAPVARSRSAITTGWPRSPGEAPDSRVTTPPASWAWGPERTARSARRAAARRDADQQPRRAALGVRGSRSLSSRTGTKAD
jgi:hypothetical protein